jgi:hypothetical protein
LNPAFPESKSTISRSSDNVNAVIADLKLQVSLIFYLSVHNYIQ